MAHPDAPARSRAARRPADERRRQLAEAAADTFRQAGFHRVTMADVAAVVGVSAPAVYRHFTGKHALLAAAVDTGLEEVRSALADAVEAGGGVATMFDRLARAALRRPDFWILLQREVRHLEPEVQRRVRADFRAAIAPVGSALAAERPDLDTGSRELVVTATTAVFATPSLHPVSMAQARLVEALTAIAGTVVRVEFPPTREDAGGQERPGDVEPAARTETILDAAVTLFHRHGYAAVSLDDIGAAVGMAGPSIYHHYPTKAELLEAAADRIVGHLPATDDVAVAVAAYASMATRLRESLGIYVTERIHLPPGSAPRIERAASADRAAWIVMLRRKRPELDPVTAGLLVDVSRTVVHDVVRIGRLHRRPGIARELTELMTAVLTVGDGS